MNGELTWSILRSEIRLRLCQWRDPRRSLRCLTGDLDANMAVADVESVGNCIVGHVKLVVQDATCGATLVT